MNYLRVAYAAVGAFIAYMLVGDLIFSALPSLRGEFAKYPAVYRTQQGQMGYMPLGMVGMLVSMVVVAVLYARLYRGTRGPIDGAGFGALIGVFVVGAFVVHNFVNLNIGATLTMVSALAYLIQWTIVGLVIGLIYRPAALSRRPSE